MRDRLIELSIKAHSEWLEKTYAHETDKDIGEYVADYLIKNGVVHTLCKIGDTVYQTDGVRIYEIEVLNVSLRNNKPYYESEDIDFDDRAIGKVIFLTREEVEGMLNKGEQGINNN